MRTENGKEKFWGERRGSCIEIFSTEHKLETLILGEKDRENRERNLDGLERRSRDRENEI